VIKWYVPWLNVLFCFRKSITGNTGDLKPARIRRSTIHSQYTVYHYVCIIYLRRTQHAASAASRLDTRPHTPRGIIALHPTIDRSLASPFVSPPLDASRERERERDLRTRDWCRRTRKERARWSRGWNETSTESGAQKQRTIETGRCAKEKRCAGPIIDLPLERARSRWLYLKVTGEKNAPLRAFLQRLFSLLQLGSSRRTVLSVRYTAWWGAKRVRELSCAWRVRNAVVINVAYEW